MQHKIQYYNYIPLQTNLTLLATIDASDDNKYKFDSSFGRELFYSCIHAVMYNTIQQYYLTNRVYRFITMLQSRLFVLN